MKRLYALLFSFLFILTACAKSEIKAPHSEPEVNSTEESALETCTEALKETHKAKKSDKIDCSPVCGALAQRVYYENNIYYICGEGEKEILNSCNIAMPLKENSKGNFITYLKGDESGKYIPCEDKTDALMYSYAPKETENVYIIKFTNDKKYYAAVLNDENGYHGLERIKQ